MKRFSIYFLAFLIFWMSTWMVTDIHDWSVTDIDQPHPVFSAQQNQPESHLLSASHDHDSHCGVCSYDHGGHIGETLATLAFFAETLPTQKAINGSLALGFWYSTNTTPTLRPPIV